MLENFIHTDIRTDILEFITGRLIQSNIPLENNLIIFPNKRPAFFLRKLLHEKIKRAFIPPKIISIDELVENINKNNGHNSYIINSYEGSFIIYSVLKESKNGYISKRLSSHTDFMDFFYWGTEIYRIFEDFFNQNISEKKLKHLTEIAEFEEKEKTAKELLLNLNDIFNGYRSYLEKNNFTTRGLNYLKASAGNISFKEQTKKIWFINFYLLTNTEKKLFSNICEHLPSEIIVRGEEPIDKVFRELSRSLSAEIQVVKNNSGKTKIFFHKTLSIQNQMLSARNELIDTKSIDQTAVIMPSDGSLYPFLWEGASYLDRPFNIALEYPLIRSPFYQLLKLIFILHESVDKENRFNTRRLMLLLNHPYIKNIRSKEPDQFDISLRVNRFSKTISEKMIKYINIEDLTGFFENDSADSREEEKHILNKFFRVFIRDMQKVRDLNGFLSAVENIIAFLKDHSEAVRYALVPEFWQKFIEIIYRYRNMPFSDKFLQNNSDLKNLIRFFNIIMESESVNFEGTPLKGFQVMGLLETRSLKFDKILFFDLNEGVIPSSNKFDPLLSNSIKKQLGLFTYRESEEIFRHYFRSVILSAREAHLYYISDGEKVKSRFLEEFIWEKELEEKNIKELKPSILFGYKIEKNKEKKFIKRKEDIDFLLNNQLSVSKIDLYLNCPIRFYFSAVLGLSEPKTDELGPDSQGKIAHKILENVIKKGEWNIKTIEIAQKDLVNVSEKIFKKYFRDISGEVLIFKTILENKLIKLLEYEKKFSPSNILSLEGKFFNIFDTGKNNIKLAGKVDRIDERYDRIWVLDYKTGEIKSPKISKLAEPLKDRKDMAEKIVSFQLPLYILLVREKEHYDFQRCNAALVSVKNTKWHYLFKENMPPEERLSKYEIIIKSLNCLLDEMLDINIPFSNDSRDEKYCSHCPYSLLC